MTEEEQKSKDEIRLQWIIVNHPWIQSISDVLSFCWMYYISKDRKHFLEKWEDATKAVLALMGNKESAEVQEENHKPDEL